MAKPSNLRIEDEGAAAARADLNDILVSLASLQTTDGSGTPYTGEPTTTYPNMLWYDKATSILKIRSTDDAVWINFAYVDQSNNAFRILDDTQVVNSSGTQTGLVGDQTTATWEAGTGTTESLVSPAKVKAAIDALGQGTKFTGLSSINNSDTTYSLTTFTHPTDALYNDFKFEHWLQVNTATSDFAVGDLIHPTSIVSGLSVFFKRLNAIGVLPSQWQLVVRTGSSLVVNRINASTTTTIPFSNVSLRYVGWR